MSGQGDAPGITVAARRASGIVTLDQAAAEGGVDAAGRTALTAAYQKWARDPMIYGVRVQSAAPLLFCAGGGLGDARGGRLPEGESPRTRQDTPRGGRLPEGESPRARQDSSPASNDQADNHRELRQALARVWQLELFTKPNVALIDGKVANNGIGLTAFGTHQVAGENYAFAFEGAAAGGFPGEGQCWLAARIPDHVGLYLALTGREIGRADACRLGLATHAIAAAKFDVIAAALEDADPIDPVLDGLHEALAQSPLEDMRETIDRCFSAGSIEAIVERLRGVSGSAHAWAEGVAAELGAMPPLSLKVTHRAVREAAHVDLDRALATDYRLACRFLAEEAPLAAADDAKIDAYFTPLDDDDFSLPNRPRSPTVPA